MRPTPCGGESTGRAHAVRSRAPLAGCYAQDREAFARRFNINDEIGCCGACLLFYCGCGYCLLCQEYATLRSFNFGTIGGGAGVGVGTVTVVATQPGAAAMYQAPPTTGGTVYTPM